MLAIISAIGENNEIGKNGELIWKLRGDLNSFKTITMGKMIVMGKNTFNSLPKILPNRKHVVLTWDLDLNKPIDDVTLFYDKEELIDFVLEESKKQDIFIIGGVSVYSIFLPLSDELYLTEISATDETADTYFPKFNKEEWEPHVLCIGYDDNISYTQIRYTRKSKK